jgi:ATP-binding cassette subfamily B protein
VSSARHVEPDPLFGSGLRLNQHHESRKLALKTLPKLIALALGLGWRADPPALLAVAAGQLVLGIATAVGYLTAQRLLAGLFAATTVKALVPIGAIMVGALVVRGLSEALTTTAGGRLGPRVSRLANVELLERAVRVELATLEEPRFHDLLAAGQLGADAIRRVTDRIVSLSQSLVSIAATVVALAVLDARLLPLLLLTLAPKAWGAARTAGARHASSRGFMDLTRQLTQLKLLMTHRRTAAEVRAHQVGGFLVREFRRLSERSETEQARLARAEAGTRLLAGAAGGVAAVLAYGTLVLLSALGQLALPIAGAAALAIRTSGTSLTTMVTQFQQLYEDGLLVLDWQAAVTAATDAAIPVATSAAATGPPQHIRARDLYFSYPGSAQPAVRGVSLDLRRGEVVALVGENSSGKSTLAHLLTGLYLPDSGELSWDGRQLSREQVFGQVSLLSQQFVQWPFTAGVNVTIGRTDDRPDPDRRAEAAARTGADQVVRGLADGWDTLLAREFFGGTDLSGGQWQRLALARTWYRDAPVLVVDEPTSALDPAAEIEVFDRLGSLARDGRTVVLITHRLASVARADRVYVLHEGQVRESGSHHELMAADGGYARMYRLQASQYDLSPQ